MKHKYDIAPAIPTVYTASPRRQSLQSDIEAYLSSGGEIYHVAPGVTAEQHPTDHEEYKAKMAARSFAIQQDRKAAGLTSENDPRGRKRKRNSLMTIDQRREHRKKMAAIRVTLPCQKLKQDGSKCGAIRYNKDGDCLACKNRRQKKANKKNKL